MVIVCNRSLFNKYGWMAFVCYFENSKGASMNWPFPPFPNPKDKGIKRPKFNPDNFEDSPL